MDTQFHCPCSRGAFQWVSLLAICILCAVHSPDLIARDGKNDSTPTRAERKKAKAAFKQGSIYFDQKKFAEASRSFYEAMEYAPSWKIYYNIAQSEAAAKRYDLALVAFERYLAEWGDDIDLAREEEIIHEIEKLKAKVGNLTFDAPDDAIVQIDGEQRAVAPVIGSVRVTAGISHNVVIVKDTTVLLDESIHIGSGETVAVVVNEQSADAPMVTSPIPKDPTATGDTSPTPHTTAVNETTPASSPEDASDTGLKKGGIALLIAGGAVLAGGSVMGILAMKKENELYEECPTRHCSETQSELYNQGTTFGTTSTVLFISGAAFATAGAVLIVAGTRKKSETLSVRALPFATAEAQGLILEGRF